MWAEPAWVRALGMLEGLLCSASYQRMTCCTAQRPPLCTLLAPLMQTHPRCAAGKTQLVRSKLRGLPEETASQTISFNHFTDVGAFQKQLESQLEKKSGSNYAPPGSKQLVYFIGRRGGGGGREAGVVGALHLGVEKGWFGLGAEG